MSVGRAAICVDGEELRKWRVELGWTQEYAASRSGYSDRLIRKLERGGPVQGQTLRCIVQTYQEASEHATQRSAEAFIVWEVETDLERLTREWFDGVYNQRNTDLVNTMMAADVVLVSEGATRRGREPIRQRVEKLLSAFDPLRIEIDKMYVEGRTVITYWQVNKRHIGEFLGIAPTYRWIEVRGSSLAVFREQQIVEVRDHWDVQELVQQLTGNPSQPI